MLSCPLPRRLVGVEVAPRLRFCSTTACLGLPQATWISARCGSKHHRGADSAAQRLDQLPSGELSQGFIFRASVGIRCLGRVVTGVVSVGRSFPKLPFLSSWTPAR